MYDFKAPHLPGFWSVEGAIFQNVSGILRLGDFVLFRVCAGEMLLSRQENYLLSLIIDFM
jgi:hypothetical protein